MAAALEAAGTGSSFVPNSVALGGTAAAAGGANCILLTGSNAGGKSTLLRQTCIATIMAQIGCHVPAKACQLTPVDRIFTRVGASDRIMQGESTFYVELAETATILHNATPNSLVILDELGRGTSTFDGTAIAYAVVRKLCAPELACRMMFATHYHSLVHEFESSPLVSVQHMKCFVEAGAHVPSTHANNGAQGDADVDDDDDAVPHVTFLYKLTPGAWYVFLFFFLSPPLSVASPLSHTLPLPIFAFRQRCSNQQRQEPRH